MNKWQLTGVLLKDPVYHPDPDEPAMEVMNFTLKNTEKDGEGRKRAVFVECVWPNPEEQARKLFRSRALVMVEGYGFLQKIILDERPLFTMAMNVTRGEYIREMAEMAVQR